VRGFPSSTWPGTLDELNKLGCSYRWVTRFVCLDKVDAERELTKRRRQWFAKRKGIVTLLREMIPAGISIGGLGCDEQMLSNCRRILMVR
jgi:type IV secretion system protein VirB4